MIRRKVSLIGPSTLMISLPSKWVKEYSISKGDELNIDANGRSLIIETPKLRKNAPLNIDLEGLNANLIRHMIYSAYRGGFSEIKLRFDSKKVLDHNTSLNADIIEIIHEVVDNLVGVDIINQKNNFVNIKEISKVNNEEFINTIRRIFLILLNTSNDLGDAMLEKNNKIIERINKFTDKKINRLCDFCFRIINKGGIVESKYSPQYYSLINSLEEMGDSLENISGLILKNKVKKEFMEKLIFMFEVMYKLFCDYKKETLLEMYKCKNELKQYSGEGGLKKEISSISDESSRIISEIISLNL